MGNNGPRAHTLDIGDFRRYAPVYFGDGQRAQSTGDVCGLLILYVPMAGSRNGRDPPSTSNKRSPTTTTHTHPIAT